MIRDEELYNYGVKGMKWGVRKERLRSNANRFGASAKKSLEYAKTHPGHVAEKITSSMMTNRHRERLEKHSAKYRIHGSKFTAMSDGAAIVSRYKAAKFVGGMSVVAHASGHHAIGNILALYGNYVFYSGVRDIAYLNARGESAREDRRDKKEAKRNVE